MTDSVQKIPFSPQESLPHRAPMLLLTQCGYRKDRTVTAHCTIGKQCDLFRLPTGDFGSWMVLELMAQTVGIYAGLGHRDKGEKPSIGFLLGTRNLKVSIGYFKEGDEIDLSATCLFYAESGFPSQFDCRASRNGQEIAQAYLTVYQPESLESWKKKLS